ncbi:MAG: sugar phosphate isomerase/epimerase [Chloroflexales bacterium]|nr:sugar phosphate isomerase/epimerase [Chloroflexales bacterium]
MPTFAAHAFIWVGEWNATTGLEAIRGAADAGVDILEIPLLRPAEFDAALVKRQLAEHGIGGACSLVLPADAHMPAQPKAALAFLTLALDQVETLGATYLGGVLYANLGHLTRQPPTADERATCIEVLGQVAAEAQKRGITLGIEPVNRYETYLYNTASDTIKLIDAIGADNVVLHLDTYHMNIEEQGFSNPITQAGKRLGYIHLSESDRGLVGKGNVRWDEVFAGLAEVGYTGPLVLESFAAVNPDLIGATCMWREAGYTGAQLAREGIAFLRDRAAAVGLP